MVSAGGPEAITASMGLLSQDDEGLRIGTAGVNNSLNPRASSKKEEDEGGVSKTLEVLGFISFNKELFLFDKPVAMADGVERWLVQVEKAM